jgi:hypothetical protein
MPFYSSPSHSSPTPISRGTTASPTGLTHVHITPRALHIYTRNQNRILGIAPFPLHAPNPAQPHPYRRSRKQQRQLKEQKKERVKRKRRSLYNHIVEPKLRRLKERVEGMGIEGRGGEGDEWGARNSGARGREGMPWMDAVVGKS